MRALHRLIGLMVFAFFACAVVYLATAGRAFGQTPVGEAVIEWTFPTQRVDGSALPIAELKETQIQYAKCVNGTLPASGPIGFKAVPVPEATTRIAADSYGAWCYRARVVDTESRASDFTGVVSKVFVGPPKPPVIVTVETTVWEYRWHPTEGPMLGRAVGTIPLGTRCEGFDAQVPPAYFLVRREDVTLTKRPKGDLIARCAVEG